MDATDQTTRFLNVDLDIGPAPDIDILLGELSSHVVVLQSAAELVSLELNDDPASADLAIVWFTSLIGSLSVEARKVWRRCKFRRMNIGIQAGAEPRYAEFQLSRQAIAALVEMDCEVVFTVYAAPPKAAS